MGKTTIMPLREATKAGPFGLGYLLYIGIHTQEPVGRDSDTLGLVISFYW